MKKRFLAVPLAAMAVIGVGYAADLHPAHVGASCPSGFVGNYHFVNPQTAGTTWAGTLTAVWNSGNSCTATAYKVNLNNQHFRCTDMSGALDGAFTDLPGKLVLSDFTCTRIKTCDPKTEKCD